MNKTEIIKKLLNLPDETRKKVKYAIDNNLLFSYIKEDAAKESEELLKSFELYRNLEDDQETYASDEARPDARNKNGNVITYIKHGRQYFEVCGFGIFKAYGYGNFVKI